MAERENRRKFRDSLLDSRVSFCRRRPPRTCARTAALVLGLTLLVWVRGAFGQEAPLEPVRLIPNWIPQAQFSGYYMAQAKGFYKAAGLDVTILQGGPNTPELKQLEQGTADFAVSFLTMALLKHDEGLPLVNIAQTGQRSALLMVARKSSGIRAPGDLNGKKIGVWADQMALPAAFLRKNEVNAEIVPMGSAVNLFLRGAVDATTVMKYNEYHLLLNAGLEPGELTVFSFSRYGINPPEDGIYCLRSTWETKRSVCERFVRASLDGWRYACEHPEETLRVVMRLAEEAHTGTNYVHQRWMLQQMRELLTPLQDGRPMGWLSPEDFDATVRELHEQGVIKEMPSLEKFHAPCY